MCQGLHFNPNFSVHQTKTSYQQLNQPVCRLATTWDDDLDYQQQTRIKSCHPKQKMLKKVPTHRQLGGTAAGHHLGPARP
jgi:hypothetical protein